MDATTFFNIKLSCCYVLDAVPIAKHEKTSTVFGCVLDLLHCHTTELE